MLRGINSWLEANRWAGDAVLATGLLAVSLFVHGVMGEMAGLLMSFLLILPLYARRTYPKPVTVTVAALCLLQVIAVPNPVFGDVAALLVVHAATAHIRDRRWGIATLGFALVGSAVGALHWGSGRLASVQIVMFGACVAGVTAAYLLGARQRERRERVEEQLAALHERNLLLAVERDQRIEMTAAAERARIARELHDIVAHSLSVIVVQAEGGAAAVTAAPGSAADLAPKVLSTIAEASREALAEMRRMVAVLRSAGGESTPGDGTDGTDPDYAPAPGTADIPALVAQVTSVGVAVTFESRIVVEGAQGAGDALADGTASLPATMDLLPATMDLTVYRVVQESLTNVIKHAGPAAKAHVTIDYLDGQVVVTVCDDGRGSAATGDGSGHGLMGMRERVQLGGGTLRAGPRWGGGFEVQATLPLARHPQSARRGGGPQ